MKVLRIMWRTLLLKIEEYWNKSGLIVTTFIITMSHKKKEVIAMGGDGFFLQKMSAKSAGINTDSAGINTKRN